MSARKLGDIAKFLRSKNAGPFKLTLDVFFHTRDDYEQVKLSGQINATRIATLYGLNSPDLVSIFQYDRVRAIKVTFPRRIAAGTFGDSDVYGAQQHGPLYELEIPWSDSR